MEYIWEALPAIISAVGVAILGWMAHRTQKFMADFKTEHTALIVSQRNQLKNTIVHAYEQASAVHTISPMELETVNRCFDSYLALGGNHYVKALMTHLNEDMPVVGEPIEIYEEKGKS